MGDLKRGMWDGGAGGGEWMGRTADRWKGGVCVGGSTSWRGIDETRRWNGMHSID